jgi:hypothetical protein
MESEEGRHYLLVHELSFFIVFFLCALCFFFVVFSFHLLCLKEKNHHQCFSSTIHQKKVMEKKIYIMPLLGPSMICKPNFLFSWSCWHKGFVHFVLVASIL